MEREKNFIYQSGFWNIKSIIQQHKKIETTRDNQGKTKDKGPTKKIAIHGNLFWSS